MEADRIEQLNKSLRKWGKRNEGLLIQRAGRMKLRDRVALRKALWHKKHTPEFQLLTQSIGYSSRKYFGLVNRVNFSFARHGIFFEIGVGRARKKGAPNVTPKPWLTPVLNPAIDELADILQNDFADVATDEIKFTIPGILQRRITIRNS